jgi:hypothetical protein
MVAVQFTDVKTGEISPVLRDIDQFLLDDLPITWLDRPARDDLGANTKGVLNSIRELNETETDLEFDSHKISLHCLRADPRAHRNRKGRVFSSRSDARVLGFPALNF